MRPYYEYGVECAMETHWPRWNNWLAWSRYGRWILAHWLAGQCSALHDIYHCGPHRVVRREVSQ